MYAPGGAGIGAGSSGLYTGDEGDAVKPHSDVECRYALRERGLQSSFVRQHKVRRSRWS